MNRLTPTALTLCFFTPTTAFADISAQDVWDSFTELSQGVGLTISAELEQSGGILRAKNVEMTSVLGATAPISSSTTFPEITLSEAPNGTVTLEIPQAGAYVSQISDAITLGDGADIPALSISLSGPIVASGSKDDIQYTFASNTFAYALDAPINDTADMMTMELQGISGHMSAQQRGERVFSTMDLTAEALTYEMQAQPEDGAPIQVSYNAGPLNVSGASQNDAAPLEDPAQAARALNVSLEYALESTAFSLQSGPVERALTVSGASDLTQLSMAMAEGVISYLAETQNVSAQIEGSALPMPQLDFHLESANFGVTLPFTNAPTAQPVGLDLGLENLHIPQALWSMIDPQSALPHDPATLRLDLAGEVLPQIDFMNPSTMAAVSGATEAFKPETFEVKDLYLDVAGAELTAQGRAEFIDEHPATPLGLPAAEADLHVELSGSTALLNTLSQIGLIPPQMATSAQLMLSIFARPTETPDGFETDVSLTKDGAITVNGLPLPF